MMSLDTNRKMAKRLNALIREVAATLDFAIVALEIMPDHVHLLCPQRPNGHRTRSCIE